ncbi:nuclear transport factor 2 family protein [Halobium salinum]|uniref:Nuclear transport factor 2 family protein n=1 Tax=Halobium salinum TaxID=1364940 RepID=A0ABD5PEN2_9EURY|nr:nuclear transport factor 2 family protein [Halobium salinum]
MSAEATVRDYYEALRRGEPLYPYFAERPDVVKFGVGERLTGYDEVAEGLREQTRTTDDWTVKSRNLVVVAREDYAWFSDDVFMGWYDTETGREREFDTRWSGTLERSGEEWLFVGMHVSVPYSGDGNEGEDGDDAGRGAA